MHSKLFKNYLTNIYNSDFSFYDYDPAIIYNSVDTSTPGKYLVVFYFKNNMNIQDSNHSLYLYMPKWQGGYYHETNKRKN